jgi:hypothetical protein
MAWGLSQGPASLTLQEVLTRIVITAKLNTFQQTQGLTKAKTNKRQFIFETCFVRSPTNKPLSRHTASNGLRRTRRTVDGWVEND